MPLHIGERLDAAVGAGDEDGLEVGIHIAHGQRPAVPVRAAMDFDPGQVRVPGDVDLPVEQRLHLAVVVGEEHVVDRRAGGAEVVAHPLPDGDDALVVGDGADQDRSVHLMPPLFADLRVNDCSRASVNTKTAAAQHALPMKSYSTSVVGAMTEPARASRKLRSTDSRPLKAVPPHARIARSVTCSAASSPPPCFPAPPASCPAAGSPSSPAT